MFLMGRFDTVAPFKGIHVAVIVASEQVPSTRSFMSARIIMLCIVGLSLCIVPGVNAASKQLAGATWSKVYDKPSAYSWNYDLKALPDGG